MSTTLTLKNIPEPLYQRLKLAARVNRRSLNSQAIVLLEAMLIPSAVAPDERLVRASALRAELGPGFSAEDIDTFKREGRA